MQHFNEQIISSTHLDSHGEKMDLELLAEFSEVINRAGKFPVSQQHDRTKPFAGYMENAFVEEDSANPGEYFLKADVYCNENDLETILGGFSFSVNIGLRSNTEEPLFGVYLPYPFYNSEEKLDKVLEIKEPIKVGKWLRKADDPDTIALITSFIVLILGPVWKQIYDAKIAPHIDKILNSDKIDKSLKRDFALQARDDSGNDFSIYFATDKNKLRSLDPYIIKEGISKVHNFINEDEKANQAGVAQVRMVYDSTKRSYSIYSLTYRNGEYTNMT